VKDFHYTSTDDVGDDFYAQNETQEIFVPKKCVMVFDKVVAGKEEPITSLTRISNDQVYDKLTEICGLTQDPAKSNLYTNKDGEVFFLTKLGFKQVETAK
jgi:hypothetical protein